MGKKILTEEQEKRFIQEYPNKTNKELSEELKISNNQLRRKASLLGLKKSKEFWEDESKRISERMKLNNPMKREEVAKKCGDTLHEGYSSGRIKVNNNCKNLIYFSKLSKGKTLEELYGKEKANQIKEKNSQKQIENHKSGKVKTWCEGLTKETDERLKKFSERYTGRDLGEEWRNNIKETHWSKSSQRDEIIKETAKKRIEGYASGRLINYLKGKKMPLEIIKKQLETKKKNGTMPILEKNGMWKGGLSFEPYGLEFNKKIKNQIRKRDNQVCMNCGVHREKINRALDCHHINYDKNCSVLQNLISLCNKCHTMTNTNREYWQKLFQDKLSKLYEYKYAENGEIILEIKYEK